MGHERRAPVLEEKSSRGRRDRQLEDPDKDRQYFDLLRVMQRGIRRSVDRRSIL